MSNAGEISSYRKIFAIIASKKARSNPTATKPPDFATKLRRPDKEETRPPAAGLFLVHPDPKTFHQDAHTGDDR